MAKTQLPKPDDFNYTDDDVREINKKPTLPENKRFQFIVLDATSEMDSKQRLVVVTKCAPLGEHDKLESVKKRFAIYARYIIPIKTHEKMERPNTEFLCRRFLKAIGHELPAQPVRDDDGVWHVDGEAVEYDPDPLKNPVTLRYGEITKKVLELMRMYYREPQRLKNMSFYGKTKLTTTAEGGEFMNIEDPQFEVPDDEQLYELDNPPKDE